MIKQILALVGLALPLLTTAEIITFDEGPSAWDAELPPIIEEAGYTITSYGTFTSWVTNGPTFCSPECPDNGSQYILGLAPGNAIIVESSVGSRFTLESFHFGEANVGSPYPAQINVIGYISDETTISTFFNLDGINDGSGPLNDFQVAELPDTFMNLTSVVFWSSSESFSLDNIELTSVPIPAALWMFSTGVIGLIGLKRGLKGPNGSDKRGRPSTK